MKDTPFLFWVISGKNAFQAFFMVFLMTASLPLFFSAPAPTSIEATLPQWAIYLWISSLCTGAIVNLTGVYWRGEAHKGIRVEAVSCVILGISTLVYPLVLVKFNLLTDRPGPQPASLWFTIVILFGLSVASWGRFKQLVVANKELDQFKDAVRKSNGWSGKQ